MKKILLFVLLAFGVATPAYAQQQSQALVVTSCGAQSLTAATYGYITMDTTGKLCDGASGGSVTVVSSGKANAAAPTLVEGTTNPISTDLSGNQRVIATPSAAAGIGISAIVSASAEATHVLKAGAGNLYGAYATNLTATAGFLAILNSTTAPSDGAITPLACIPLPGNSSAYISRGAGPPQVYSTGITAVVTSANTCFTKTTGIITAFISGDVQ